MDFLLSLITGICLSATSGFRIFIPFLFISIASLTGNITLSEDFSWMASYPALIVFSLLTLVEIIGYYNPWIDNALDMLTTTLSLFSGFILTKIFVSDLSSILSWSVSIFLGITVALTVQFLTDKARTLTAYFKSGYGNQILATSELFFAILFSFLTIFVNPVLSFIILTITVTFFFSRVVKEKRRRGM